MRSVPSELCPDVDRQGVAPGHLRQGPVECRVEDGDGRDTRGPPGGSLDHGHVRRIVQRCQVTKVSDHCQDVNTHPNLDTLGRPPARATIPTTVLSWRVTRPGSIPAIAVRRSPRAARLGAERSRGGGAGDRELRPRSQLTFPGRACEACERRLTGGTARNRHQNRHHAGSARGGRSAKSASSNGAPGGTRTPDPRLRSPRAAPRRLRPRPFGWTFASTTLGPTVRLKRDDQDERDPGYCNTGIRGDRLCFDRWADQRGRRHPIETMAGSPLRTLTSCNRSSVRPGKAGRGGVKEAMTWRNLVCRPAGAKPA
jgi:hypothetical protein